MQSNGLHNVVACQGSDKTALEQRPMPEVGAGELLLKLRVVGFCGTDLFKLNTGSASVGTVLGHELVGEVVAVGDGVEGFNVGNRVAVPHHVPCGKCVVCRRGNETMCETFRENLMEPGGFADTVLIRPRAVELAAHVLPDHVSDEAAVFVEPAACVLRGVERSGITAEGTAVVLGGGSMGLLHLLVLHAALPGVKVIVIDPVPERRELALELGAAKAAMPGNEALAVVKSLTDDTGADAIFDTVGGNRTLQAGLDLSRQGGSIVLFAHAGDGERADFDLNDLFKYERRILGTYSGAVKEQVGIFELITSGALDPTPLVTHSMPLDEFQKGVDLVRQHKALKVLFTPSRESA
ncbi:MAG: alcohol dehydrogenase catalytic domain-containing protein [Rhodospirillales bacterium]|jgi:L-iditol 2-dehydrogenase|nr:alcohol dehydrogenase catalytic domain-containing protein [Rhodospirillaceae bacterium]MBT7487204.1 alcohol dehydrogenase catalytic domain-containing protein [Rhodospirillales bacterium]MBT5036071.1 alcohol dehydrogenase catalytic domain-containing protein [Rhodospirillaceae bacterium]MBT6220545.1 alcohol dehydrogenase catalytic domain-containing protein [Rhodospirillaceae bacterium]MBT6362624.1 alcohol dehydrogenase catalytic domain-containing protein [Rhodospirillaceae bacterium]